MIRFAASALALTLATGSAALADSPHQSRDRGHDYQERHAGGWSDRRGGHESHGYYGHRWQRGEWLPPAYRTRYYYAPDYRRFDHRVYAPPPGCRWVRNDGGDLLLMALATGIVLDVIYDRVY